MLEAFLAQRMGRGRPENGSRYAVPGSLDSQSQPFSSLANSAAISL